MLHQSQRSTFFNNLQSEKEVSRQISGHPVVYTQIDTFFLTILNQLLLWVWLTVKSSQKKLYNVILYILGCTCWGEFHEWGWRKNRGPRCSSCSFILHITCTWSRRRKALSTQHVVCDATSIPKSQTINSDYHRGRKDQLHIKGCVNILFAVKL